MAGASVWGRATKALKVLKALKADGRQRLWRRRAVDANRLPTAVVARRKRCLFCVVGKDGGIKEGEKTSGGSTHCGASAFVIQPHSRAVGVAIADYFTFL